MAKKRQKNKAFALDDKKTRCAEQACNISQLEGSNHYFLEYYIIKPREYIEESDVFISLNNKSEDISKIMSGIKQYQADYRYNKNLGLKARGSKTVCLQGFFDDKANLLDAQVRLSSKVNVDFLSNEMVTKQLFDSSFPVHRRSPTLKLFKELATKVKPDIKNSSQLSNVIDYLASLMTAHVAKKNNLPFLYKQDIQTDNSKDKSNFSRVLYRLVTQPSQEEGVPLQASAATPLREFHKAMNLLQLSRFAAHDNILSEGFMNLAALAANKRLEQIVKSVDKKQVFLKKIAISDRILKNMTEMELLAASTKTGADPAYEAEFQKRLEDPDKVMAIMAELYDNVGTLISHESNPSEMGGLLRDLIFTLYDIASMKIERPKDKKNQLKK